MLLRKEDSGIFWGGGAEISILDLEVNNFIYILKTIRFVEVQYQNDKQFTSNTSCFIGAGLHVSVLNDHHQALS